MCPENDFLCYSNDRACRCQLSMVPEKGSTQPHFIPTKHKSLHQEALKNGLYSQHEALSSVIAQVCETQKKCSFDDWYVWLKLDVVPRTVDLITNGVKQVWTQSQTDLHTDSDVDCQRILFHQILFHVFSNFSIMVSFCFAIVRLEPSLTRYVWEECCV